ncbi:MAG: Fic family protein [Cellulomonadaceae bacterium]|nr:Fic family protein [Cellulomonadaceae bacterium]
MPQPRQPTGSRTGRRRTTTPADVSSLTLHAHSDWPAVELEEREWTSTLSEGHLDVYQRIRMSRPYEAAVPPTIADLAPRLSSDTLDLQEQAVSEVIRFDTEMAVLPVPMPSILLRTESASSSQIEHLTSNARNIALAELGAGDKENAALIVANVQAMRAAMDAGNDVDAAAILAIHRCLLAQSDPDVAGRWRDEQVWVGSSALSPHGADFVPPHHERVSGLIDDLAAFSRRTDIPALAHAALLHAQFETIHPFVDGNGRTGRVLVHTVLRARGVTRHATVPVSAGLLRAPDRYFAALTAYRAGDVDPIVQEMSNAALAAVANGRQLAGEFVATREAWREQITARSDSSAWRLADVLFSHPVINADRAADELRISARAARSAIDTLVTAGVLTPMSDAQRNRVWQAPQVLGAIDAFARRAGRRAAGH